MKVQFKCVKITRFDGHTPKLGADGKPIVTAKIAEDGTPHKVHEMEPCCCFTVEFEAVSPLMGKLELDRIPDASGFAVGKTHTFEI